MPGCAQKNRPVRSVIVATVGQRTAPVRRRRASTTVTAGYVETTTSGSCAAIVARQRARAEQAQQPAHEHAHGRDLLEQPVDDRVGPREEAQLHAVAVLDDRAQQRPIAARPSMTVTSACCGEPRAARPGRARPRRGPRRRRRTGSGRGAARGGDPKPGGLVRWCVCDVAYGSFARPRSGRLCAGTSTCAGTPAGRARTGCQHDSVPGTLDACARGRRNNGRSRPPTPTPACAVATRGPSGRRAAGARAPAGAPCARLARSGLLGVLASAFLLERGRRATAVAVRARAQRRLARLAGRPAARAWAWAWAAHSFQTLTLSIMCASYAARARWPRARCRMRALLAGAIVLAHVACCSGPPLISQDVFGYLAFARMGALHGLDPYTHFAAEAPARPGVPVRRLAFPALALRPAVHACQLCDRAAGARRRPVGVQGDRGRVEPRRGRADRARGRAASGRSARWAAAFVGLNPVLLVLAVGRRAQRHAAAAGAGGRAGADRRSQRAHARGRGGALAAGVGVKVTAGLALPFLVLAPSRWRERRARGGERGARPAGGRAASGVVGFGIARVRLPRRGRRTAAAGGHAQRARRDRAAGGAERHPRLVAPPVPGGLRWWCSAYALWRTDARRRLARGGRLDDARAAVVDRVAAAVVCDLAAAASGRQRRPAPARRHARCSARMRSSSTCRSPTRCSARPPLAPRGTRSSASPAWRHRLELTGFQMLGDVKVDLRW